MDIEDIDRIGGHPALDFVNTVNRWDGEAAGAEYLADYAALLRWHRLAGLVGPNGSRALSAAAPRAQAAAHREALAFRAALHQLFRAVAHGADLPQAALDRLNDIVHQSVPFRRIAGAGCGVACGWDFDGAPPVAVLGPVAWQAVELLEHGPLDRIKECPSVEGCGWLFVDSSKNRSRTWCDMRTCGNAAKVKRFRERHAT